MGIFHNDVIHKSYTQFCCMHHHIHIYIWKGAARAKIHVWFICVNEILQRREREKNRRGESAGEWEKNRENEFVAYIKRLTQCSKLECKQSMNKMDDSAYVSGNRSDFNVNTTLRATHMKSFKTVFILLSL